jgi:type II secretory pathway pseudopilin PulG
MFSLLITIVAVALVAALAIATIYYGGPSMDKSKVRAEAAMLVNQAAQVDAAILMFRVSMGRWPTSESELVAGNFLKSVPQAPVRVASNGFSVLDVVVPNAHAATTLPWRQVAPSTPQFWLLRAVSKPVCQAINLQIRGDDGIYNAAVPGQKIQCFGQDENYTVLLHYTTLDSAESLEDTVPANGGVPTLLVEPSGAGWAVVPNTVLPPPSDGSGSGSGESTAPAPTVASLVPTTGPSTGGTTVTVTGANFQSGAQAMVNGIPVATTIVSSTEASFVTPAATAGSAAITVVSSGKTSSAVNFTYVGAPTLGTISPNFGPMAGGTTVTLTGQNFASPAQVSVGGVTVPATLENHLRLTFVTPSGTAAGPVDVMVTTGGQTSSALSFNYLAPTSGTVTTLSSGFHARNWGNLAADDNGHYVMSGKNFYHVTHSGVSTVIKNSGWGAPCSDSNVSFSAWSRQANGDIAAVATCSTGAYGFALRVSVTGQIIGSVRSEEGLLALTVGPDSAMYILRRDGTFDRYLKRLGVDGSYMGGASTPSTLGMAVDPTAPYLYYVTQATPTIMVLYRCRTTDLQGCTFVEIGRLNYASGTTGDDINARPHLAFDGTGQLYAATPSAIYKMDKNTGASTVYVGKSGTTGNLDGTGNAALLDIRSIGRGHNGKIYFDNRATGGAYAIRRLD